ncbi:FAD-dependent oxidoreductase [Glutamicibacter sp. MNS18]|uniref:NAD(P)/FAD-dependent oxidoreductase n=1 Tax=Glutamicibacter sp. MNS18 TaxID=2989817 RepID=UPI0022369B84|nr:FAD-dependent oxidoreductase [Glutamicibacter sp. MNS18]MCW4465682.1 FAD-dependent oxidoreductase [Glutamicibacter sp. MNS18]
MGTVQVIGAGVAGFSLARHLVRAGYGGQITLYDPQGLPYDRPPLSKSLERVHFAEHGWFQEHGIELVGHAAQLPGIPDSPQDWLVLATGTTPRPLQVPGAEYAQVLHDAADAEALARKLSFGAFGTQVVVIGAGLVGAEFAAAARQLGAMVTLIGNHELPGGAVFGPPMARQLHEEHRTGGIRVITGTVQRITEHAVLVQDEELEADIVVAAIGVEPNTRVARRLGLATDDGILVDRDMRTSAAQVLAVGDAARQHGHRAYRHWERATEDAEIAAATIMGTEPPPRRSAWFWTDRHESHVEVVGDFSRATHTVERHNRQDKIHMSFGLDAAGTLVAAAMADDGTMGEAVRKLIDEGPTPPLSALQDPRISPRDLGQRR